MRSLRTLCLALAGLLPSLTYATDPGVLSAEFIYEKAPFPSCHASTIVETPGGLVAAWFGGTKEGHPDVGIWLSHHTKAGWSAPEEVANGEGVGPQRYSCFNPVLHQVAGGPLLLFYKVGVHPDSWLGFRKQSTDGGKTWSAAERLPEGILGPIKNKPVVLPDGTLLSGTSTEHDGWRVHFERSSDQGQTWRATAPVNDGQAISAIQPSILLLGGEKLRAIGRTKQGRLFQIDSADAGKTWGEMTLTPLPNPNSGTDAVTLRDGRHLLIYNHTTKGRSPLNLALSQDGTTWQAVAVLETAPGEYSYPAIIQTQDGLVHATYTWKREKIRHVVIDPAKLQPRPFAPGAVEWPK